MNKQIILEENNKLKDEILNLKNEILILKDENDNLKSNLKKYTAPSRNKTYYEKHKDDIIKKVKEYKLSTDYHKTHKTNPEKQKEYNRRWYLKKKEAEKEKINKTETENENKI